MTFVEKFVRNRGRALGHPFVNCKVEGDRVTLEYDQKTRSIVIDRAWTPDAQLQAIAAVLDSLTGPPKVRV